MIYFSLVLLCFFGSLICDIQEIAMESLKESYKDALPFIQAFHKDTLSLNRTSQLSDIILYNSMLSENSVNFKFENDFLHIEFLNVQLSVTGRAFIKESGLKQYTNFNAKLGNFSYDLKYWFSVTKLETGKYEVYYSLKGSSFGFHLDRLTSKIYGLADAEKKLNGAFLSIDFIPYQNYLVKIAELILETLPDYLNKK